MRLQASDILEDNPCFQGERAQMGILYIRFAAVVQQQCLIMGDFLLCNKWAVLCSIVCCTACHSFIHS